MLSFCFIIVYHVDNTKFITTHNMGMYKMDLQKYQISVLTYHYRPHHKTPSIKERDYPSPSCQNKVSTVNSIRIYEHQ